MGELLIMKGAEPYTVNLNNDGEFLCMLCGHYIIYTGETEWSHTSAHGGGYAHMHGTEPFHFCPNCGREILTPELWVDEHPEDAGKTWEEIGRRYF